MPKLRSRHEANDRKRGPEKERPQRRPVGEGAEDRFAAHTSKTPKRRNERRDEKKDPKPKERKVASRTKAAAKEHPKTAGKSGRTRAHGSPEDEGGKSVPPPEKRQRRGKAAQDGAAEPTVTCGGPEDPAASNPLQFGDGIMEEGERARMKRKNKKDRDSDSEGNNVDIESEGITSPSHLEPEADYGDPPEEAAVAAEPESAASEEDDRSISDSYTYESSNPSPSESQSSPEVICTAPPSTVELQSVHTCNLRRDINKMHVQWTEHREFLAGQQRKLQKKLAEIQKDQEETDGHIQMIGNCKKELIEQHHKINRRDNHPNRKHLAQPVEDA